MHSTTWKLSLHLVYMSRLVSIFLTKFWHFDQVQWKHFYITMMILHPDYSLIHTIYRFSDMNLFGNSHWGYPLTKGVHRWRMWSHSFSWKGSLVCNSLFETAASSPAMKLRFGSNKFGKSAVCNLQTRIFF